MTDTHPIYGMTFADLKNEFRLMDDGDSWGSVMAWWFDIAEEIYFNRDDLYVPDEWSFTPSLLGPCSDPNDWIPVVLKDVDDPVLLQFGKLMFRYAQVLKHAGKDY